MLIKRVPSKSKGGSLFRKADSLSPRENVSHLESERCILGVPGSSFTGNLVRKAVGSVMERYIGMI